MRPVDEVQLCVEAVPEEEFGDQLPCAELLGEPLEVPFMGLGRPADGELIAELFRHLLPKLVGLGVVDHVFFEQAVNLPDFVVTKGLHPDQEAAFALTLAGESLFDDPPEPIPAS